MNVDIAYMVVIHALFSCFFQRINQWYDVTFSDIPQGHDVAEL
jgi:hypothetical protein